VSKGIAAKNESLDNRSAIRLLSAMPFGTRRRFATPVESGVL